METYLPDKVASIFVKNMPENQYLINKYADVKPIVLEDEKKDKDNTPCTLFFRWEISQAEVL
jgi:hypothetical protein